jgi:hypothetical protein
MIRAAFVFALLPVGAFAAPICAPGMVARAAVQPHYLLGTDDPLICPEIGLCWRMGGLGRYSGIDLVCMTPLENKQAEERYAAMGGTEK